VLAPGCPANARTCTLFHAPHAEAHATLNVTSIDKRGGDDTRLHLWFGRSIGAGKRRRHRGETTEDEEKDATLDLLLKHSNATLVTYV
jgi:hypothetical protein